MNTTLSCMIWLLIFFTRTSLTNGYIELRLDGNDGNEATDYLDFSITTNRLQLQLTQLDSNADLEFSVEAGVFETDNQGTQIATLTYKWNTHSGRNNMLSLYDTNEFEQCDETKTEMLTLIPVKVTVDLNTDYLVEIKGGEQGTFSSSSTVPCPAVWTSFTSYRAKVTKMKLKLADDDAAYKLENIYTVEYRIITACNPGQYLYDRDGSCTDCETDHYGAGVWLESCTKCPEAKGVEAGKGTKESDCTWKPCEAGQRLDQTTGCKNCPADHWSASGNTAASCTACAAGKEVGAGLGKEAGDCTWKPCTNGGQYLDQATGCQLCDADTWGSPGSTSATCTPCPTDKGVAAGAGSSEGDCTWKGCAGGQYLDQSSGCQNCLADHWSPVGSKSPTCSNCPADKEVTAGQGKLESDCTWKACVGGQYLNQEIGCTNCEAGEFSAGGTADSCTKCEADTYSEAGATKCTACPSGKVVASGEGRKESDCAFKSCLGGYYVDSTKGCLPCGAGEFSAGGAADSCTKCEADTYSADKATKCTDCPPGKGVASGDGKEEVDCKWKPCAGGHYLDQEKGCLSCEAGAYSVGGTADSCSSCLKNQYSAAGASQCTDCPVGTGGVAAGTGTEESQCREIVWTMTGVALIRAVPGSEPQIVSGSQGVLVVTTASEVAIEIANVTFCKSGYDNTTANTICQLLGFGDGTFGSSPQNFEYVPESLLSSMDMPRLAVDDCAGNLMAISAECVGKMMATSCEQDEVVWIKCAEVIDDRDDSSSTKISATVTLVIVNIGFALFW